MTGGDSTTVRTAGALTEKQQTIFGPINSPTLNNAPFQGAQAVPPAAAQRRLVRSRMGRMIEQLFKRVESGFKVQSHYSE